ncbi:MAG: transglutaminase-like domain-containing protein [Ignavibacteriaceae bacterium]|nr:transglutaminase-like domain-containing protein [Ignavibacteriaceae bacterium]
MLKKILITFVLVLNTTVFSQQKFPGLQSEIGEGNYKKAGLIIDSLITFSQITELDKYELSFQKELMDRIEKDFTRNRDYIFNQLKKYYPQLTDQMLVEWESSKALEMKLLNGEKRYFKNAIPNLFRIDKEAKKVKESIYSIGENKLADFLSVHIPALIYESNLTKRQLLKPVKFRINYELKVKPDVVPAGEVIRCWLPYPRSDNPRQLNINLKEVNPKNHIISGNEFSHSSIYLEQTTVAGQPTIFSYELEYLSYGSFLKLDDTKEYTVSKNSEVYSSFTTEQLPHIHFSDKLKEISQSIIGTEKNNYKKIKLIIEWLTEKIPWASAREYSTLSAISDYCLDNMHGDCGIKSLLFITLCRYNGIPAKWQSGWMLHPGAVNLHDWAEVYFDEFGWITVDPDFGIQQNNDDLVKYFYASGIDPYRYIVNDDYGKPLYPGKIYPRSETLDFQRGEVEWRGGNLYFDRWNYDMKVTYLSEDENEK